MTMLVEMNCRNAQLSGIAGIVDSGSNDATPDVVLQTSANTTVLTCNMSLPAFDAPANGQMAARPITEGTNSTGSQQVVTRATVRNRNNESCVRGNVGVPGSNAEFITSSTTVPDGGSMGIASLILIAPAGSIQ